MIIKTRWRLLMAIRLTVILVMTCKWSCQLATWWPSGTLTDFYHSHILQIFCFVLQYTHNLHICHFMQIFTLKRTHKRNAFHANNWQTFLFCNFNQIILIIGIKSLQWYKNTNLMQTIYKYLSWWGLLYKP